MFPLKWKIYRISNYLLLIAGAFLFVKAMEFGVFFPEPGVETYSFFITIMFLLMLIKSIINLFLMAKTFPNKQLTGNKRSLNVISILANFLSAGGLFVLLVEFFTAEFKGGQDDVFILVFLLLLWLIDLFVLICQLGLSSYLRGNTIDSTISKTYSVNK